MAFAHAVEHRSAAEHRWLWRDHGGLVEGIEINLLGAALGVEVRRPAINLPGLGRFGI